jgi:EAL domain-containing protein (putative c-di-GMP-specific phosphodiesterase class I)
MALSQIQNRTRGPSQEYLLLDYLQRLGRNVEGRMAVHIHLSRLRPQNRQDHHIRIAAATFEGMVQNYEGQIFTLSNSDLFFICKDAAIEDIDAAIMKVRYLFSEDPLSQGDDEEDLARFCTWFNVASQYEELLDLVKQMHRERERKQRLAVASDRGGAVDPRQRGSRKQLDPEQLGKLETFLTRADLSNLMRRQPICAMTPGNPNPQPVFRELYISISDLQQTVLPEFDIASNLWLFQHLTQTLDARMLSMLIRNDDSSIASSFSINLNVQTILSPPFLNFDSSLKAVARGTVVIELQKIDIFGDMGAYMFARDFMRERGYRICLDGLNHLTLQFIDRERLGLDLLKLVWSPDLADDLAGNRVTELKEHVDRCGRARIILCRCDSDEAVRFGQSLGITMYQGRYIDRLLANETRVH